MLKPFYSMTITYQLDKSGLLASLLASQLGSLSASQLASLLASLLASQLASFGFCHQVLPHCSYNVL